MAKGLVYRIVQTGLERGWWTRSLNGTGGTVIIDPFAGIGSTGLACSAFGIRSVLVELEEKFVRLARENFALHEKDWQAMGYPAPQIIQGDSRRLLEIVQEAGGGITSPPYISLGKQGGLNTLPSQKEGQQTGRSNDSPSQIGGQSGYGTTPGQLGVMKEGKGPIGAITSPPFLQASGGGGGITAAHEGRSDYPNKMHGGKLGSIYNPSAIGQSEGQISSMKEGRFGALTSPPYEGQVVKERSSHLEAARLEAKGKTDAPYGMQNGRLALDAYSADKDNLGNQRGDTYWGACRLIYEQLYQLFSPGSHLAIVVKSFVRNKKIVDLPGMTLALLEDIGFESVAWVEAKLAEEGTQSSALPELVAEKQKKRMSFFRRLHETKYPHLAINEEVVLVVKK